VDDAVRPLYRHGRFTSADSANRQSRMGCRGQSFDGEERMKINLTAEEIREGIQANDNDSEIRQALGGDSIKERAGDFNLDMEKIEALAFGRALHMVEKMGLDKDFMQGMIYTASFGAMWLDGLFAALAAIDAKPEDCS
jgi:hypothetical protein